MTEEAILEAVRAKKESLMKEVYTIMTATLGVPPPADKRFVFDYCDKDGKPGRWEGTPIEFYKVRVCDSWDSFDASRTNHIAGRRLWKVPSRGFVLPHQ